MRRHTLRDKGFWLNPWLPQRQPPAGDRRDRFEHTLLGHPVRVVLRRHEAERVRITRIGPGATAWRAPLADGDETIVLVERQPAKGDRVHDGEDGGRGADAKRQDDKGGERHARG